MPWSWLCTNLHLTGVLFQMVTGLVYQGVPMQLGVIRVEDALRLQMMVQVVLWHAAHEQLAVLCHRHAVVHSPCALVAQARPVLLGGCSQGYACYPLVARPERPRYLFIAQFNLH